MARTKRSAPQWIADLADVLMDVKDDAIRELRERDPDQHAACRAPYR